MLANCFIVCFTLVLTIIGSCGAVAVAADQSTTLPPIEPPAKEERVRDTAITLKTSYGTVDIYESLNTSNRFYVAPNFAFLPLPPDYKTIARATDTSLTEHVPVQMIIAMVHPQIRVELIQQLSRAVGRDLTATDVRNLKVASIRVDVYSEAARQRYHTKPFVLLNPAPSAEKLPIEVEVDGPVATQFAKAVNQGDIVFTLQYSFNQVLLDSRVEMLRASTILDNQQMRDLVQRGQEIMNAKQMAAAAANAQREIESKVIESIGKVEPASLSIDRLIELFRVGKTWEMTEQELAAFDERLRKQFSLNVDPAKFQPFRFQQKVASTVEKETTLGAKKKAYFDLYQHNAEAMTVSAGIKIGPFGGSGEYSKAFDKAMRQGSMSDDEFHEHLKTYHGLEYTTEGVLERGVEIYDIQKVRQLAETKVISATVKPYAGVGVQGITLAPSAADVSPLGKITVTQIIEPEVVDPQNVTLGSLNRTAEFTTYGGNVMLTVSGSGYMHPSQRPGWIGMDIYVDETHKGSLMLYANAVNQHLAFPAMTFPLRGLPLGKHTLRLRSGDGTQFTHTVVNYDQFSAFSIEVP